MIITNLVGTLCILHTLLYHSQDMSRENKCILLLFWFHGVLHLPFSVGNHIFKDMNEQESLRWLRYDNCMICVVSDLLIFLLSYYVFTIQVTLLLTCMGIVATYRNFVARPDKKSAMVLYIGIHVLLYSYPVIYQSLIELHDDSVEKSFAFYCILTMFIGLSVGAFTFTFEFPQFLSKSGRFDLFLNGHNIMHFGVAAAYFAEYLFLLHMIHRDQNKPLALPLFGIGVSV